MLKIRLQRTGKVNEQHFRLVLTEKSSPAKNKALEILGFYNPRKKEKSFKKERISHWISKGAQPSDTAFNLLLAENVVEGKKIQKQKISKKKRMEIKKQEQDAKAKALAEAKAKKAAEEAEKQKETTESGELKA